MATFVVEVPLTTFTRSSHKVIAKGFDLKGVYL